MRDHIDSRIKKLSIGRVDCLNNISKPNVSHLAGSAVSQGDEGITRKAPGTARRYGLNSTGTAVIIHEAAQTARQPNSPSATTKDGERGPGGQWEEQESERAGQ
jgi:hypothetical protein